MKCYITNMPHCDGFGAKFQRILYLLYFSYYIKEKYNKVIEFILTPLDYEGFGRNFGDFPTKLNFYYDTKENFKKRAVKWNEMLNYQEHNILDLDISKLQIIYNPNYNYLIYQIENDFYDNKLYVVDNILRELEENINIFSDYKDDIISKFNIKKFNINKKININIHIRRGDAMVFQERISTDEYYLDIINIIENNIKKDYKLTIYTQKENFNVEKFKNYDVVFDELSEDYDVFRELVFSDILIMGRSSFSYSASMLNKNLVVYPYNFYHKKLKNWIEIDELKNYLKNE